MSLPGSAAPARNRFFAAFGIRSFRFQWSADLLTSWAFEMENLILGWYVLVATNSVFLLTVFGALQFIGTLLSPYFGMLADRVSRRGLLIALRAAYGARSFLRCSNSPGCLRHGTCLSSRLFPDCCARPIWWCAIH